MPRTLELPFRQLQEAMYARLVNDGIRVYDEPPENDKLGYAVIGDFFASEGTEGQQSKGNVGYAVTAVIDLWSSYRGAQETHTLANSVSVSLTDAVLTVADGWRAWNWQFASYSARREVQFTGTPTRVGELQISFWLTKP